MEQSRANLLVARNEARAMIGGHIKKGKELLEAVVISNDYDLKNARESYSKWRDYAKEMLKQLFNNDTMANSMNQSGRILTMNASLLQRAKDFRYDFERDITSLESVEERLPLIPEPTNANAGAVDETPKIKTDSSKVFVVHGRDVGAKSEVARFLERLQLQPVILHEQANEGKTLIEKFEAHSKETGYALIILSPDDLGSATDEQDKALPRARQNVVFEWGYFVGRLGRDRVNALYFEGVELPSDNDGLVYTPFDKGGAWQLLVARELKRAGYQFDMNKL